MSSLTGKLSVRRAELAQALKLVGRTGAAVRAATAALTYANGQLAIDLAGSVALVAAEGDWPGEVRVPGQYLESLANALPHVDPLPIKLEAERLFVATFSIPCESSPSAQSSMARELIPANADLFDLLLMASRCSALEIHRAGATALVAKAQAKLDQICDKAAGPLRPYGITPSHLKALCAAHVEEGSRQFRESDLKAITQIADVWRLLAPLGVEPMEIKALMDNTLRNAWKNP